MTKIIIVNGYPESGKTTFELICKEILEQQGYSVGIISTIDPIKKLALSIGWDGHKDVKGRKFLSDLKDAMECYCDYSYNYIVNIVEQKTYDILFVDAREPVQIVRFCEEHGARSILLKRNHNVGQAQINHADLNVEQFNYEFIIENNDTISILKEKANQFIQNII